MTRALLLALSLLTALPQAGSCGRLHGGVAGWVAPAPPAVNTPFDTLALSMTPTAFWKMSESSGTLCVDATGKFTGVWQGTPSFGQPGLGYDDAAYGEKSVAFSGDDYVEMPCATNFSGSFTIVMAVWRDPISSYEMLFTRSNDEAGYDYGSAGFYYALNDLNPTWLWISIYDLPAIDGTGGYPQGIDDSGTHFIACSWDLATETVTMYDNGAQIYQSNGFADYGSGFSCASFKLGARLLRPGSADWFYGENGGTALMSKVLWYDRAVSPGDIATLNAVFWELH